MRLFTKVEMESLSSLASGRWFLLSCAVVRKRMFFGGGLAELCQICVLSFLAALQYLVLLGICCSVGYRGMSVRSPQVGMPVVTATFSCHNRLLHHHLKHRMCDVVIIILA